VRIDSGITDIERRLGIAGNGNGDWSKCKFIDTLVTVGEDGKVTLTWSGPRTEQPVPPMGAVCTDSLSDPIRFFEQDLRPLAARSIPSAILFRRAITMLHGWAVAALDGPLTPEESRLRQDLLSERAVADERERLKLLSLGIDPSEVDAAFEVTE
jgi:hypothetical protein